MCVRAAQEGVPWYAVFVWAPKCSTNVSSWVGGLEKPKTSSVCERDAVSTKKSSSGTGSGAERRTEISPHLAEIPLKSSPWTSTVDISTLRVVVSTKVRFFDGEAVRGLVLRLSDLREASAQSFFAEQCLRHHILAMETRVRPGYCTMFLMRTEFDESRVQTQVIYGESETSFWRRGPNIWVGNTPSFCSSRRSCWWRYLRTSRSCENLEPCTCLG